MLKKINHSYHLARKDRPAPSDFANMCMRMDERVSSPHLIIFKLCLFNPFAFFSPSLIFFTLPSLKIGHKKVLAQGTIFKLKA